jgi:RimJ/RimL family protein N-acetyltransferase
VADHVLRGKLVVLRPATLADRRPIYEWAACSDATPAFQGPPTFPDEPVPTWEAFCDDYKPYFFDGSAPMLGRCFVILVGDEPVGQLNYNDIEERGATRRTELDIWLRAERFCGHGYGTDALLTLCDYLAREFGVQEFMMQPSARNPRAIRAYEKVGFASQELLRAEAEAEWGHSDYYDSVTMVKTLGRLP